MRTALSIPPGLQVDSTLHSETGHWTDASNIRFVDDGSPEVVGGWESLTKTPLTGVCRTVFPWTDNINNLTFAFGTHSNLELWQGGAVYDVTPTLALPSATLSDGPLTVAANSNVLTIFQSNHGLIAAETIKLSGSPKVGRQVLADATYTINAVVDANRYTVNTANVFTLAKTLANASLSITNASVIVRVNDPNHNLEDGSTITVAGANAATLGNLVANGTFTISVVDGNTYTYFSNSIANVTTSGGGPNVVVTAQTTGGEGVVIAPQRPYSAGQINGTGTIGYGTGGYGIGGWGSPSDADYFPRTWSFGAWGENLLASYRDGTIHAWTNNTAVVASPLANAPARVGHMLVAPASGAYQAFALACSEEASGKWNPMCIRHSSIRNFNEWNTSPGTTAREYILTGGGRIVGGRMVGPKMLVWTDSALFVGSYIGNINQVWRFERVGQNCGLIGPNAAVVVGQTAFWISPDRQFYSFSGGSPTVIPCPIREDFAKNLAASQGDKIVASSIAEYGEVRWDYPDGREGFENSRYLNLKVSGPLAGIWTKGIMARTAMVDAGPSNYPTGCTFDGTVYWHERGTSADGAPFAWFIESADQMIGEDRVLRVTSFWPDFKNQLGAIALALTTRFKPQGAETTKTYNIGTSDEKVDVMTKGRYLRLKFSGNSSPTAGRIGAPVFDIKNSSRR